MRSKNWSCKLSRPLIRKDFTRFWPVWGSYLAVWLLILPIPMLTDGIGSGETVLQQTRDIQNLLMDISAVAAPVMTSIYGGVAAFAVWSYLYQGRSASLFHALPVTRETLFASHFTAGLGFIVAPNVLIALLTWLCQASLGYFDPRHLLCWLAVTCLEGLLFFSIGTLAAHMTGSLPAMPVLYGLINFAVVVCESLLHEYATMLYFGITSINLRFTLFSPFVHLLNQDVSVRSYTNMPDGSTLVEVDNYFNPEFLGLLCLYALAALALSAAALLIYRKRATESAGDVIAVAWLRPIAKYAFSFACALTLGWLLLEIVFLTNSAAAILFCLILAGTVGYIVASMLLKKSFRVFTRKQLLGLPALWLALALIVGCYRFDLLGTERLVPDESRIQSVTLTSQYNVSATADDPQMLTAITDVHRAIIADRDVLKAFDANRSGDWVSVRLNYVLTNGYGISRRYYLPYDTATAADPATALGKVAALLDDPQLILEESLPPDDAVIESLSLYMGDGLLLYAAPEWSSYVHHYVDTAHIPVLRKALKEDILAGRLARWHREAEGEMLCGFEFSYDIDETVYVNLDPNSMSAPVAQESVAYQKASRWSSVYLYECDTPTATLEALHKLGYLTEVPHE